MGGRQTGGAEVSEQTITENFSEKPRRGRPPLHCRRFMDEVRAFNLADAQSDRGINDHMYGVSAMQTLFPKGEEREARLERFRWLYDAEAEAAHRPRHIRRTLLAHLGRLRDPDLILKAADHLCEWRPTTAVGVAWLRRLRTGKPATGDSVDLANALIVAFNTYMGANPETGAETVEVAMQHLRGAVATWAERHSLSALPA